MNGKVYIGTNDEPPSGVRVALAGRERARGGAFQAILDGFPLGRAGREIYGNPVVISGVGLVKNFVERGCIIGRCLRHLVDGNVGAAGRMTVLQVNSLALSGQFSIRR